MQQIISEYGVEGTHNFSGVMPKIIEKLGGIGEVKNTDIDTSIFTNKGKPNEINIIVPNFFDSVRKNSPIPVTKPEEVGSTEGSKVLAANMVISEPVSVSSNVQLNLNGKTITNTNVQPSGTACPAISVQPGAKLTLSGDGIVDGGHGGDNSAVMINNNGEALIEGGTYSVGGDKDGLGNSCIYLTGPNSTLEITGGEYRSLTAYNGKYYVINSTNKNKDTNSIIITGGKFWDFNPSNVDIEIPAKNYVPEGYKVTSETIDDNGKQHIVYTVSKNIA